MIDPLGSTGLSPDGADAVVRQTEREAQSRSADLGGLGDAMSAAVDAVELVASAGRGAVSAGAEVVSTGVDVLAATGEVLASTGEVVAGLVTGLFDAF